MTAHPLAELAKARRQLEVAQHNYAQALLVAKEIASYHEIGKALGLTRAGAQSAVKQARTAK